MKIAIAIATAGRRVGLCETIGYLRRQIRQPDALYVCPASDDDVDPDVLNDFPAPASIVKGGRGLTIQRNTIMRAAASADLVVFFDDDFVPEAGYLAEVERLFAENPDVVIATGDVLADGATNEGILFDDAVGIVESAGPLPAEALKPVHNGYGCNMAVRMAPVRENGVWFDEALPLYGWWEDVDFSRRLAPYGRIVKSYRLRGVHMGSKSGRSPGKRLGYSQVMNIVYMIKKRSVAPHIGAVRIAQNVVANAIRQFAPEPWVDRRGRLQGNLLALAAAVRGRINPADMLTL